MASEADLSAIQSLLHANVLPIKDVSKALIEGFLVAEGATGSIIGVGGLEHLNSKVLLRSLAVAPEARGAGIARALIARLESSARSCNKQDIWLLTTTAAGFFERAGYEHVSREKVPDEVRSCRQFATLCPPTVCCMRKRLCTASCVPPSEQPVSN